MMTRSEILKRLGTELTRVVGALAENSASSRPFALRRDEAFVVSFSVAAGQHGAIELAFVRDGAEAYVKSLSTPPAPPTDEQVLSTLKEISTQAIAAIDHRDLGCTLQLVASEVGSTPSAEPESDGSAPSALEIVINGHERPLQVVMSGRVEPATDRATAEGDRGKTLDVIMDIDLPLVVRFGRTELPLKALTALGPGSVIDLGRSPDEPVDVLISNRVVARGEVVIVSGNYGVRVRDVVSPAERARSLEAELA
jgi:flagellar motor switch protein FliN/FliY